MSKSSENVNNKYESFLASYFIAYRIFGYLSVNQLIREPETADAEGAYVCEFAGLVREVSKNLTIKGGILAYHGQFGLDGIINALEFDLKVRGNEWELKPLAEDALKKLKEFSNIM